MSEQQQTLTIQQALDLAVQHHNEGRLSQAEIVYKQILQSNPNQPTALHLLGAIAHQMGKNERAVKLINQALGLRPDYAEAHNNLGLAFKQLGKVEDAVASYRKALTIRPDFAETHNNLGNALQELGKLDDAVASYHNAIALNPDSAGAQYNLGLALHALGKLEDAINSYRKALKLKPDYAEAHNNLGLVLQAVGYLDDAVESYQKAGDLKPDLVEAHDNLGNALRDLGKLEEAVTAHQRALALKPDYADAHNNLGIALQELGKLEEAVASYRKALEIKPNLAMAHNNLGTALQGLAQPNEAIASYRRAVTLDPRDDLWWGNFAVSLEAFSFDFVDDTLYQDLLQLLERPTVRPSYITQSLISALRHHPDFSQLLKMVGAHKQDTEAAYSDVAKQLSNIPLFLRVLELSPIHDLDIEQMLTILRRAMLQETTDGKACETVSPFSTALALQCFTNEYVFAETDDEKTAVQILQRQVALRLEKGQDVPPSFVVTLGAYKPLFDFFWAQNLGEREWGDNVKTVIKRQIMEPQVERSLLDRIPCITPIQNAVSQSVREQYEENPYPRWIRTGIRASCKSLGTILRGSPLCFDLGDYVSPENPEILIAGCGTGHHALCAASEYSNAHVLAVDLSLNSLSYALRKTHELGFSNIEYVQGDIMELGKIERQFDLIECGGVLHHLGDPLAGWQVLVKLLRPGGLMKIGLYSEIARQHIIAGRSLIAERGYSSSPEDIRRCRQDIIAMVADGNTEMQKIFNSSNFFSLSECRDLLFHVQEHRFTLLQIEEALLSLDLKFLGFEMRDQRPLQKFKESHSSGGALIELSLWHQFELDNPDTFIGMYQFWCKTL